MTPETIEDQIKKIALLFRYGTKEKIFIFIGATLFGLATWIPKVNEFLKLPPDLNQPIALGLYVLGGLCLLWVVYRFLGSPYKSMQVDFYQRVTGIGITNKNLQVNAS